MNNIVGNSEILQKRLSKRSTAYFSAIFPPSKVDGVRFDDPFFQVLKDPPTMEQPPGVWWDLYSRADLRNALVLIFPGKVVMNEPPQALVLVPTPAPNGLFELGQ
jgi:hypothetical protein